MTDAGLSDPAGGSPRGRLAVTAEAVVAATDGVALTDGGHAAWQTADRGRRIRGLTVIAQPDGRYELGVHLAVAWPPQPLPRLADELRRQIVAAAGRDGLEDRLGDVNVDIAEVALDSPEEAA